MIVVNSFGLVDTQIAGKLNQTEWKPAEIPRTSE
jgi:hypothetical protein